MVPRFYCGLTLFPLLFVIGRVFRDSRIRLLSMFLVVSLGLNAIQIFFVPHYLAPFTAAFYCVGLQCVRHLAPMETFAKTRRTGLV